MQPANQSRKGIPHTEETKIKISNSGKGRKLSEETKRKISDNHKRKGIKPLLNSATKYPSLRGKGSEENKPLSQKSLSLLGNTHLKGYKNSEEAKARIAASSKLRWEERKRNANTGSDKAKGS